MISVHKRPKTDPYFKGLFFSNYQVCPGCSTVKSNLPEHSKSCPGLKKQKKREEIAEEARLNRMSAAPTFTTELPSLKKLEEEPFEECFRDYLSQKSETTRENYVRHVKGFFTFYEHEVPQFEVKFLFTKLTLPPEEAVVLKAHFIRSYANVSTATMALNMAKAMQLFMLLYKDFVISKYEEVYELVMRRAQANIEHANTILTSITKTAAVDSRALLALNREKKREQKLLGAMPKLVRLYCRT